VIEDLQYVENKSFIKRFISSLKFVDLFLNLFRHFKDDVIILLLFNIYFQTTIFPLIEPGMENKNHLENFDSYFNLAEKIRWNKTDLYYADSEK